MGNMGCPQSPLIEGDQENDLKDCLRPLTPYSLEEELHPWLAYLSHIHGISNEGGSSSSINFTLWHAAASNEAAFLISSSAFQINTPNSIHYKWIFPISCILPAHTGSKDKNAFLSISSMVTIC